MDLRVEKMTGRFDAFLARAEENEKYIKQLLENTVKSAERSEKAIEKASQEASNLRGHIWAAVIAIILSAVGTFYATQSSNLSMIQTFISAVQFGKDESKPTSENPTKSPQETLKSNK